MKNNEVRAQWVIHC